ncbi:MAG: DUF4430 domain-containing protein [Pirellulales bacterium]
MTPLENSEDQPTNNSSNGSCGCNTRWRLPLLLAVVLAAILLLNRTWIRPSIPTTGGSPSAGPATAVANDQTISLAIDFGEGLRREWNSVSWRDGMTVADVLSAAARPTGDELEFAQQGTGASAFLTRFGDTENEGAGGRNWTYLVNGKHADRSFAVYVLQPGDQVLWKFDKRR